jgi:hypothetical protein
VGKTTTTNVRYADISDSGSATSPTNPQKKYITNSNALEMIPILTRSSTDRCLSHDGKQEKKKIKRDDGIRGKR